MKIEDAKRNVSLWADDGLKNIRFSGGEPTVYKYLLSLVEYTKSLDVERIAISTNGSALITLYQDLIGAGINDFSISLDACCSTFGNKMAGTNCKFDNIISNIKIVASQVYTTVGIVVTEDNLPDLVNTITLAHNLGVADIRIISAAQYNKILAEAIKVPQHILDCHPILKYRINNIKNGRNVRGLQSNDSNRCYFPIDDSVIAGGYHFPCVIYMREKGKPIGKTSKNMRSERIRWSKTHNTHNDQICKTNCLDVCIDHNNTCLENDI